MVEESTIEAHGLKYTLKRSGHITSVRLAIYRDGRFIVTAPYRIRLHVINTFISQKLSWIHKKLLFFKTHTNLSYQDKSLTKKQRHSEYLTYKETARARIHERLQYFNQYYGFTYNDVRIKNVTTRWGSCSKKGNLNFSYKLALLPTELSDYIIVHELCHLKELNHSANFWLLVAKTIPDYKERRNTLRKNILV